MGLSEEPTAHATHGDRTGESQAETHRTCPRESLFPAVEVGFDLGELMAVEDWILDALTLLLAVVIEQAEDIAS